MSERIVPTSPEMDQTLEQDYQAGLLPLAPRQLQHRAGLLMDYLDSTTDTTVADDSNAQAERLVRESKLEN